jgi:hypothetical protein
MSWRINHIPTHKGWAEADIVDESTGRTIANVRYPDPANPPTKMLSAVPDLIAAAEYAAKVLEEHTQYDDENDQPSAEAEALGLLSAAVAKAKGKL